MGNFCSNYVLSATRYIEDGDEIKKYFAAFHLLDNYPAAVIVDDFADFFSERCNFCSVFVTLLMTFVSINCELHAMACNSDSAFVT